MKKSKMNYNYKVVFIIFAFICISMSIFCFRYYIQLQDTIREEGSGYLQEVSRQISRNINKTINDNYAVLKTIASILNEMDMISFSDVQPVVEMQQNYWNYEDILLIDDKGIAYNSYGKKIALNTDVYLRDAVLNKGPSMSTSQVINNMEYIIFAIPMQDFDIEGKKIIALASSYDPNSFVDLLSLSSFNEKAYSQIISKDGTTILRSDSSYDIKTGYNVINSIAASELDPGSDITALKNDIVNDRAGQISFTLNGIHSYMIYTPVYPEDWCLLTFVPVSVVNEKSDLLLKITLIICGVISLVFAGLIACLIYIFYRNKNRLEQIAYVDQVTGGNTIQKFYDLARVSLSEANRPQYALVYTNFEKFKVLNEQFGRKTCDNILHDFNNIISEMLMEHECMGRSSADNFCILIKYTDEVSLLNRFREWYANSEAFILKNRPVWSLPITSFGIYIIDNDTMPFPLMVDRAKLAMKEAGRAISSKLHYAIYNDEVRRRLFRDKMLEDIMEDALKNREFQVYLQPKYRVSDEKIGGAEALIRWNSPSEGMIYPDEFIPLFEKNGFIVRIDLWVFEEVCRSIRSWIDAGLEPMKVSVNCSRVHLKNHDFLNPYREISERYCIPSDFIEIEFTESVVMEDVQLLTKVIDEIHDMGFECSMDDFGSGYSSLNLIQDITVDTLKLDGIFFRDGKGNSERMWSVVNSIISLAKELNMEIVAEGVEHREQVELLKKTKCDYIQGYVFARPMPISQFEDLAFGTGIYKDNA